MRSAIGQSHESFFIAICVGLLVLPALLDQPASAGGQADAPPFYTDKTRLLIYLDAQGKEHPVTSPQNWQIRRDHILRNMQLVMGPLPKVSKSIPFNVQVHEEVKTPKYIRKLLTFSVDGKDRLPCYLFIPTGIKQKVPAILCLHPTSRPLGKKIVIGEGPKPNRAYAVELAERGFITIAPDYPNMGGYQYDPYKNGYASATMKAIINQMRCVDFLQSLPEVDPDNIGAIGHSLGGHNSIFVAAFDTRIKCIVSCCGFCSFPTYYKGNLAGWSHDGYMPRIKTVYHLDPKKVPFDFTEVVAALAPRAFLAVAPTGDSNFDCQGVKDCIAAARPVYQLLNAEERLRAIYPQAEHDFPDDARRTAYEWIDRWLRKNGPEHPH